MWVKFQYFHNISPALVYLHTNRYLQGVGGEVSMCRDGREEERNE